MRRWLTVAALVALAGCGGSSSQGNLVLTGAKTKASASARHAIHTKRVAHHRASAAKTTAKAAPHPVAHRHDTFIAQADGVCRRTHIRLGGIGRALARLGVAVQHQKLSVPDYFAKTSALTLQSADIAQQAVAKLTGLAANRKDPTVATYLHAAAGQAQILHAQGLALRSRDTRRAQALNGQLVRTGARVHAAAKRIGFHDCGG
jgi:hypothetical protein